MGGPSSMRTLDAIDWGSDPRPDAGIAVGVRRDIDAGADALRPGWQRARRASDAALLWWRADEGPVRPRAGLSLARAGRIDQAASALSVHSLDTGVTGRWRKRHH